MKFLKNNDLYFNNFHHIDSKHLDEFYNEYEPVFILSTGRSGSKYVVERLKKVDVIDVFHEPNPTLMLFQGYSYNSQANSEVLLKMIEASRTELILNSFNEKKIYVESNQCLTFFAYQLKKLFPKSKFIILYRDPSLFIRSAIEKGWYLNDTIWEIGRMNDDGNEHWDELSQFEKLIYDWNLTYSFLLKFFDYFSGKNIEIVNIENFESNIKKYIKFITNKEIKIQKWRKKNFNKNIFRNNEPENIKRNFNIKKISNVQFEIVNSECFELFNKLEEIESKNKI